MVEEFDGRKETSSTRDREEIEYKREIRNRQEFGFKGETRY